MECIYPSRCVLCDETNNVSKNSYLCAACEADILLNKPCCQKCALPMPHVSIDQGKLLCGDCMNETPSFDLCWSPFVYAQPLEWMIQQLKFNDKLVFARVLSSLFLEQILSLGIQGFRPDVIIPMPLHKNRLKQRGFNQSHMLIKPVAKSLSCLIDVNSSLRVKNTEHQTGKTARQRKQNIKGAFEFANKSKYEHVVIFDDVVTTGSSVNELCKVIKRSGVSRVDVWSLARAEK